MPILPISGHFRAIMRYFVGSEDPCSAVVHGGRRGWVRALISRFRRCAKAPANATRMSTQRQYGRFAETLCNGGGEREIGVDSGRRRGDGPGASETDCGLRIGSLFSIPRRNARISDTQAQPISQAQIVTSWGPSNVLPRVASGLSASLPRSDPTHGR